MPMLEGVEFHSVIRRVGIFEPQPSRYIRGNSPCVCTECEVGLGSSHSQYGRLGEQKSLSPVAYRKVT